MIKNLKKNRFWLFKALETYALALYFIVKRSSGIFSLDGYGYLEVLDDPPFVFTCGSRDGDFGLCFMGC